MGKLADQMKDRLDFYHDTAYDDVEFFTEMIDEAYKLMTDDDPNFFDRDKHNAREEWRKNYERITESE